MIIQSCFWQFHVTWSIINMYIWRIHYLYTMHATTYQSRVAIHFGVLHISIIIRHIRSYPSQGLPGIVKLSRLWRWQWVDITGEPFNRCWLLSADHGTTNWHLTSICFRHVSLGWIYFAWCSQYAVVFYMMKVICEYHNSHTVYKTYAINEYYWIENAINA